jgi:outer membrane protein assembly factor BamB
MMMVRFSVCCLLALTVSTSHAQEWPRFRGLNGTGQSEATDIPTSWTDRDYNWKVELPGVGHSSPVLWGSKVFLTSAGPSGTKRMALCLDASDGRILWEKPFDSKQYNIHLQNSFASSTPTVDKDRVYFLWGSPESYVVYALDHEGNEVWKKDLGPFASQHGFGASPIVYHDMVIVTNDQEDATSSITALDCKSGDIRWTLPRSSGKAAYSTPCVRQLAGKKEELIFASNAHGIFGIDPATGKPNWEVSVFELRTVGSPILINDLVLASCGEGAGNNSMVAIRPGSTDRKPTVVYKIDKSSAPYVPTIVANGHLAFLWSDKGVVTCIDGETGQVHWRQRVGGTYSGSPIRIGNHIYCISSDGEVVVLAASDKYELVSRQNLGEVARSTPAVADGRLYLRTQSHLFSLGK